MADLNAAYDFLLERAMDQKEFQKEELGEAAGWAGKTPGTYLSKQLRSVVERKGTGRYRVKLNFLHMQRADFVDRVSQKEVILPSYTRWAYNHVVNYEFLMPLTREGVLRSALDNLFYRDTLEQLIHLQGLQRFEQVIHPKSGETEEAYCSRVARKVADYFSGYSISHVSGRFRADSLITQIEAVGKRYIVDETTALVRFIIPLQEGRTHQGELFHPMSFAESDSGSLSEEISLIRTLFFNIFAEVVVHSVQGEDEIWLIETTTGKQKLYKWEVDPCD